LKVTIVELNARIQDLIDDNTLNDSLELYNRFAQLIWLCLTRVAEMAAVIQKARLLMTSFKCFVFFKTSKPLRFESQRLQPQLETAVAILQ
jgi:hypothetical protein